MRTSAAVGRQTLSGSVQRGFTLHTELSRTILGSLPSACTTFSFPMAMPLGHLARASCSPPGISMTHPWAISSSIRRWRRSGWASAFFQLVSNSLRQVSSGCWACWASTAGHWLLLTMGSKTPVGAPAASPVPLRRGDVRACSGLCVRQCACVGHLACTRLAFSQ